MITFGSAAFPLSTSTLHYGTVACSFRDITFPHALSTLTSSKPARKHSRNRPGAENVPGTPVYFAVGSVRGTTKQATKRDRIREQAQDHQENASASLLEEKIVAKKQDVEHENVEEVGLGRIAGALRLIADGLEAAGSRITRMFKGIEHKKKVTDQELEGARKAMKWVMGEKAELERRLRGLDEEKPAKSGGITRNTFVALCKTQIKLSRSYQEVLDLQRENSRLAKELQGAKDDRFLISALMALLILYIVSDIFGIPLIKPYN